MNNFLSKEEICVLLKSASDLLALVNKYSKYDLIDERDMIDNYWRDIEEEIRNEN